ncbi:UDP-N-acetylmuramate dehydrogenase [Candidatus Anaplasma sp. TIGMIC]|uniref:UDP-N-acetylmuramate dehydrogenase n=1 Tax=Candidatus Anaplasma sp. TIGMIC TaxID=3020713 RepID=UPI00233022F5|nr:UDP-N-acetylmuramate dehydrogenase [Candidatus Anaplasma sp. TIGMIC]MDB1135419.1 UDP-N-acetylmuramate dehydrogenase [Candidatus Anaplasma sp. TIGMIC]
MSYTFTGYKLPKVLGAYKKSVKMHSMTWTGVGGVAPLMFKPQDAEDLAEFLRCTSFSVKALGAGSNVIIRDGVVDKVIIKLGREFADMTCDGNTITVGCAAALTELVAFARENSLTGFEFCVGIPGTVGGAVATNVSAYDKDIASVLHSVRAVNEYGEICTLSKDDMEYSYRRHGLCGEWIFVEATFVGQPAELSSIKSTMSELVLRRNASQPIYTGKVIGYVFKNPEDNKEARVLIEEAGCRGMQRGNAIISEKHCNFIENIGGATASEIEDLGHEVRRLVEEKFGITLEWNIEFLGARVVK